MVEDVPDEPVVAVVVVVVVVVEFRGAWVVEVVAEPAVVVAVVPARPVVDVPLPPDDPATVEVVDDVSLGGAVDGEVVVDAGTAVVDVVVVVTTGAAPPTAPGVPVDTGG